MAQHGATDALGEIDRMIEDVHRELLESLRPQDRIAMTAMRNALSELALRLRTGFGDEDWHLPPRFVYPR